MFATLFLLAGSKYGRDTSKPGARWMGSWAASQQLVEPGHALEAEDLRDATLRQIVHLSLGGAEIRLRLSNRFGSTPLHLTSERVARPTSPSCDKTVPGTDKALTFSGSEAVTVPSHPDYLADPLSVPASALPHL